VEALLGLVVIVLVVWATDKLVTKIRSKQTPADKPLTARAHELAQRYNSVHLNLSSSLRISCEPGGTVRLFSGEREIKG
jgi:hypothetical protein